MAKLHHTLGTLCAALIWIAALSAPASGLPAAKRDLAYVFADCAGRMSAMMEFQWMFDGAASERTDVTITRFDVLIDATAGPEQTGRELLNWRIEAKMAQSRLLNLATFGQDERLRRQAARAAAQYVAHCEALLLG
ncbi:hypothetical protein [Puniceibacterium sediminis]|uniref:Lysozyme inhibitor LprI N-terminal domain-containing protein n=1 Tax=Puniceibacterium sediminis TaxID=1608407 RepID=A0A238UWS1_9RHOB|nr:hypothetical protein [Puniceibacterium sediminis]SNR26675.1 hypothetical protein SAMN06265370_101271 [Puniceibacterium sediminis]